MNIEDINTNKKMVCSHMPTMVGCTVDNMCQVNTKLIDSKYCSPFAVYKLICTDMSKMHGCKNYTNLCSINSVVQQCNAEILPVKRTADLQELVNDLCTLHNMPECSECTDSQMDCEVLTVYSNLCKLMPYMDLCSGWKSLCGVIPSWPLCPEGSYPIPVMRMYFHAAFEDYIFLESVVPSNLVQYIIALAFCFFLAFFYEAFRIWFVVIERNWALQGYESLPDTKMGFWKSFRTVKYVWKRDFVRGILRMMEFLYSMLVMLLVMSFNIGFFVAIVLGVGFSSLIFGKIRSTKEGNDVAQQEMKECH